MTVLPAICPPPSEDAKAATVAGTFIGMLLFFFKSYEKESFCSLIF